MNQFTHNNPLIVPKSESHFESIERHFQQVLAAKLNVNLTAKRANKLRDITASLLGYENGYQQIKPILDNGCKNSITDLLQSIVRSAFKYDAPKFTVFAKEDNTLDVHLIYQGKLALERVISGDLAGKLIKALRDKGERGYFEFITDGIYNLLRVRGNYDDNVKTGRYLIDIATISSKTKEYSGIDADIICQSIRQHKSGLFLFAGATGSGKTTTVNTVLHNEDYKIDKSDLPPEAARHSEDIKKILREYMMSTPNVIIYGEIRDHESAEIALDAAKKGTIVVATICANSTQGAYNYFSQLVSHDDLSHLKGIHYQMLMGRTCKMCSGRGCLHCDGRGANSKIPVTEYAFKAPEKPLEEVLRDANGNLLKDAIAKFDAGYISEANMIDIFGNDFLNRKVL